MGPGSLPAAKNTDKQGHFLPSGCSELRWGVRVKVNDACGVSAVSHRESFTPGVLGWPSAFTQSTLSVLTRLGAARAGSPPIHLCVTVPRTVPDYGCLLDEPSVCFVLIYTSNPHSWKL